MIEALISSKTRIKLLLKFFLNKRTTAYLRGLSTEFGESSNSIRIELNRFEEAGMLTSFNKGNKRFFKANTDHPLFNEVHSIILKYIGIDKIVEGVVDRLGNLQTVFLTGDFAEGKNSSIIDLIFVGENMDKTYLFKLLDKAEGLIERKIRYVIYTGKEMEGILKEDDTPLPLMLWTKESDTNG